MSYANSYLDYLVPAGYLEYPDVFDKAGKALFRDQWTGKEVVLPVIDDTLKQFLKNQDGEELFRSLTSYFKDKKQEVEELEHKIISTKEHVEKYDSSFLSFLHDPEKKKERNQHFSVATKGYAQMCQQYQAWVDTLLVREKTRVSLNAKGIASYLYHFVVDDYLRQVFFADVATYLFNPVTGGSELIAPHIWLGKEYELSCSTGEAYENGKRLGIILIPEDAVNESLDKLSGDEKDKEVVGLKEAIKQAVVLCNKTELTKDEEENLLETIALQCLEEHHQQYNKFPKKSKLSLSVFNVIQQKYSNHFPQLNTYETIERKLHLSDLKDKFTAQQNDA